jgi:hypothetical protein
MPGTGGSVNALNASGAASFSPGLARQRRGDLWISDERTSTLKKQSAKCAGRKFAATVSR